MQNHNIVTPQQICWQGDVVIDGWENINIFFGRGTEGLGLDVLPPLRGVPFSNRGESFVPGNAYYNLETGTTHVLDDDLEWRLFCSAI